MRTITFSYQDPLELIWLQTAREFGMSVLRDASVFASWDGTGVLRIGAPETLDADDSLAQMILHETCHALIEGPEAWSRPDWGLDIDNPAQRVHEYACLRLQAALADQYGLRAFLASTTNFRNYYDGLPANPLDDNNDPAVVLALVGWQRARHGPWARPLDRALRITSVIANALREIAPSDSLWSRIDGNR